MTDSGWEIVEDANYPLSVGKLGGAAWVDWATAPILYSLSRNPLGFELVPGHASVRLAKTSLRIEGSELFPGLNLWFKAEEGARRVVLLWVEVTPSGDLALTDDFWRDPWDDAPPF